ncbi:MAG: hypothetical protein LUG18_08460 [Candidatus Azobacteroides sp.]|nr:hypothetical protein [Candidatus Azobacteroides sp.]
MKLEKISSLCLYGMLGVTVIIIALFYLGGTGITPEGDSEPVCTGLLLNWMYGLLGGVFAVITTFFFVTSFHTFKRNPHTFWRNFFVFFGIVVLLAVTWFTGSGEPLQMGNYRGTGNVYFWLKTADMFLYAIYIMLGLIILLLAGINIYHIRKK